MSAIRQIELDPILTAQIVYEGQFVCRQLMDEEPSLREIVWHLLQEAVKVDRSIVSPGPSRRVTHGIEYYHDENEITAAYNQVLAEIREAENDERAPEPYFKPIERQTPDAMAHRRYLEVMGWLRVVKAKTRIAQKRRAALILALAGGMSPRRAVDAFPDEQFPNRKAVAAARHRALSDIEKAVKRACKSLAVAA